MEWNSQGARQGQPAGQHQQAPAQAGKTRKKGTSFLTSMRLVQVILLFLVTALLVALIWFFALGGKNESRFVDDSKLQAVFLNGGQVYFGDIDDLNGKFISMSNIYYLRVNQQVQPNQENASAANDISLVKLGCELHGPQDRMVINREQVIFWENLKEDGQVAKAVQEYKAQNPGEQNCATQQGTGTGNSTPATGTQQNNSGN